MSPSATGSGHTWQWGSTAQPRDQQLPARAPGLVVLQAQNTDSSAMQEEPLPTVPIALQGKVPARGRMHC